MTHMYADNIINKVLTILSFFPKKSNFNKYNDIVLLYQMFPPCFEVRFVLKIAIDNYSSSHHQIVSISLYIYALCLQTQHQSLKFIEDIAILYNIVTPLLYCYKTTNISIHDLTSGKAFGKSRILDTV